MTELERVEIEGFKGLEYVEFEPTDINLITGRNNTGKTSFLEAIHIASHPEKIRKFDENVRAVVRRGFSEGVIETKTTSGKSRLVIRGGSSDETNRYLREAVTRHLRYLLNTGNELTVDDADVSLSGYSLSTRTEDEEIPNAFYDIISKTATRVTERVTLDSFDISCLILELGGEQYPYLYFGQADWDLISIISDELGNCIEEQFDEEAWEEHPDGYVVRNPEAESRIVRFGTEHSSVLRGGFFVHNPPDRHPSTFIESTNLLDKEKDGDAEDNAIRIDDIGDFVKDRDLAEQLKTFNLETLIFESQDDGKYPVPFDFMGDGFKSMVGLLWELMDDEIQDQIVLVEEPENHMHPGYIAELVHFLIDLAKDEDIQFFITTHDHDFIKDFFMDMPDEKREYLEDEFSLVKMDGFGADIMEYQDAEHHLKDLHLDLRGI